MKTSTCSLETLFPKLVFAKKADDWLKIAPKATIFQQLDNRRIHSFCILPILSTAAIGIEKSGDFIIYFNEFCKPEWAMGCIGHEIGHTFHFDLKKDPPVEIIDQQSKEFFYDFDKQGDPHGFIIEDFCDEFARRWLAINTKKKIRDECACRVDQNQRSSLLTTMILMFSNIREKEYTL